jgi:phosphoglycolate phosphatase
VTSPPVDDPEMLRRLMGQAEALFLDFDGPICDLFAGLPAPLVVDQLCAVLADGGYGDPPLDVEKSNDPFDMLKYAAALGEVEARYVNAAFAAHEVEAASAARPNSSTHDLIRSWSLSKHRPLAIVSNNSKIAVQMYLHRFDLCPYVGHVAARTEANPMLLKPSGFLLDQAALALGIESATAAFVGDSVSDYEAAQRAGSQFIGFANKNGKIHAFRGVGVACIVTSIEAIGSAIIDD